MINIRYHIVSITAVFLALGIGVALGSTFLDRATVDVLDRNIRSAENRIKATNEENDQLTQQLAQSKNRDTSLITTGSETLVADQLADVPVLAIAAPGVEKDDIDAVRLMLEHTGADFRGTVLLSDKLAFRDADDDLARRLELTDPTVDELRTAGTSAVTDALAAAGAVPAEPGEDDGTTTTTAPGSTGTSEPGAPSSTVPQTSTTVASTTTTEPERQAGEEPQLDGKQPAAITALIDRGYLKLTPGDGYTSDDPILETEGYRYVYIGGPNLDAAQNDVLMSILPAEGDALPATVISATQVVQDDEPAVPTVVARVRASDPLRKRYNTVDNTDTFAGLTAMLFTLDDMGSVVPGQYGQAAGATAILPPSP
jgi:hypothetical protein